MSIHIRRILCPLDFSENSEHALLYAREFARAHDAELILLHVIELPVTYLAADVALPADSLERQRQRSQGILDAVVEETRREWPRTRSRLEEGNPHPWIVLAAREEGIDLIVMGTHGRTGLAHVLMGSVAEKVVRMAPCPVLTVKHPEREFVDPKPAAESPA